MRSASIVRPPAIILTGLAGWLSFIFIFFSFAFYFCDVWVKKKLYDLHRALEKK